MKIIVTGSEGRMGREVIRLAQEQGFEIAAGVDRIQPKEFRYRFAADLENAGSADALIDFSSPAMLPDICDYCAKQRIPAVLATTGYDSDCNTMIKNLSKIVPVFLSANMSVGIALLRKLAEQAARTLGDAYDIEIVEAHHRNKIDTPSGTALMLAESVRAGRNGLRIMTGRTAGAARREDDCITIHSIRGGSVAGEHAVMFLGLSERITITHGAENRAVFASGALRAAAYLMNCEPSIYTMDDLIAEG